jgi:hypothetical protein
MKNRAAMLGLLTVGLAAAGMVRPAEDAREMSPDDPDYDAAKKAEADRADDLVKWRERRRINDAYYLLRDKKGSRYDGDTLRALRAERGCGRPPKRKTT